MSTNQHSLKTLTKSIVNKLENNKYILFNPRDRNKLNDELYGKLTKQIWTEEDINQRARDAVAAHSGDIEEQNFTETEAYQTQKKMLKSKLSENELRGFYFIHPLREVCIGVRKFLFDSPVIEDVFETDENIQKLVLDTIQGFDETKIS